MKKVLLVIPVLTVISFLILFLIVNSPGFREAGMIFMAMSIFALVMYSQVNR